MPDRNTPERRTVLTCVDAIVGTHRTVSVDSTINRAHQHAAGARK